MVTGRQKEREKVTLRTSSSVDLTFFRGIFLVFTYDIGATVL